MMTAGSARKQPRLRMREPWRPQVHYSAEKNMINDPNGLVFFNDEFHLFHQYNLHEVVHWGHATSTDLVHWTHQRPALYPDFNGQVYSGTAVVDHHNDAGLATGGEPAILAYFTHADHHDGTQSQGLAFSTDAARTWQMHPWNPIVPNPGIKDFRDPKVFRHEPSNAWIMVVTCGHHLQFLRSENLIDWEPAFTWGQNEGAHGGLWECPDVFELPIGDGPDSRWVVSVSVADGAPAGGSGMQYFTGLFDGYSFINDNHPDMELWQNWGQDYYAGLTWENVPATDGRRLMIAWVDNWLYRFDIPTEPFNGQLTVVRQLDLIHTPKGVRLRSTPVTELESLRGSPLVALDEPICIVGGAPAMAAQPNGAYEVLACFDLTSVTATEFGVAVHVGPDQATKIGYTPARGVAFVDRSRSGEAPSPHYTGRHEAPVNPVDGRVWLRIIVDASSVEVFVNDREQLTDLLLPNSDSTGFHVFAEGGDVNALMLRVYPLAPVWAPRPNRLGVVHAGQWIDTDHGIQGSSSGLAIATLAECAGMKSIAHRVTCSVEIVGTRHRNPTKVLGQVAAGVAVGFDPSSGSGIAVVLDHPTQRLEVHDLATGTVLADTSFPVEVNRAYSMSLTVDGGGLVVEVDHNTRWEPHVSLPKDANASVALLADNCEAIFRPDC